MRTRKWLAVVLVFLTLAYCGIAAVVYDHSASVEVYCFADTPALSWAKRHGASISLLGDSEKEHLQYLESFTYTRNDLYHYRLYRHEYASGHSGGNQRIPRNGRSRACV